MHETARIRGDKLDGFEAGGLAADAIVWNQREHVRESVTPRWLLQPAVSPGRTIALARGVQTVPE